MTYEVHSTGLDRNVRDNLPSGFGWLRQYAICGVQTKKIYNLWLFFTSFHSPILHYYFFIFLQHATTLCVSLGCWYWRYICEFLYIYTQLFHRWKKLNFIVIAFHSHNEIFSHRLSYSKFCAVLTIFFFFSVCEIEVERGR